MNNYKLKTNYVEENVDINSMYDIMNDSVNMFAGLPGTFKTCIVMKEAVKMITPTRKGKIIHYDLDEALNYNHVRDITGLSNDGMKKKYNINRTCENLDTLFENINKVIHDKKKNINNYKSLHGKYIVIDPTVLIIDSTAMLILDQDDNKKLYSKLLDIKSLLKELNIIIVLITHINRVTSESISSYMMNIVDTIIKFNKPNMGDIIKIPGVIVKSRVKDKGTDINIKI